VVYKGVQTEIISGDYLKPPDTAPLGEIETAGFEDALNRCKESTEGLTGGFEGFASKLGLGDTKLGEFSNKSDVVSGTLEQQALATDGVISGAIAQKATSAALQTADGVEAASSQMVASEGYRAAAALSQVAASGGGSFGGGDDFSMGGVPINGIGGLFASGGSVGGGGAFARFAAGGGVMMRDRIPSLLEPGEFVMKKTSVDSIGRSSMERMNATGKASGSPTNIKIQVDNSGQPKEAQQGETQFDGETAIVKLILKDLSSNGPIRRSIRGNT
jgi:hypothetical protein